MTAIFELPLPSETLAADELAEITGALTSRGQAEWLAASGWRCHTNRAGRPIVGRMYARLKLAGIEASAITRRTASRWISAGPRRRATG